MTGYQIQKADGFNAFCENQTQVFETLAEAREWAKVIKDEQEEPEKLYIMFYDNGVNLGIIWREENEF